MNGVQRDTLMDTLRVSVWDAAHLALCSLAFRSSNVESGLWLTGTDPENRAANFRNLRTTRSYE